MFREFVLAFAGAAVVAVIAVPLWLRGRATRWQREELARHIKRQEFIEAHSGRSVQLNGAVDYVRTVEESRVESAKAYAAAYAAAKSKLDAQPCQSTELHPSPWSKEAELNQRAAKVLRYAGAEALASRTEVESRHQMPTCDCGHRWMEHEIGCLYCPCPSYNGIARAKAMPELLDAERVPDSGQA